MSLIERASAKEKHRQFRRLLMEEHPLVLPGVFNALSALAAQDAGAKAVYVSGAGVINSTAGLPDIGLLSLGEVVQQLRYVTHVLHIPAFADADTGFGEGLGIYRSVIELEATGISGIHIEDQEMPKRCGHLEGKRVVSRGEFIQRIRIAVRARTDSNFVICARTDARAVEGMNSAIERAKACLDAGADMVFPEALGSREEFEQFATTVNGPLLANMTEFGKTPLMTAQEFAALGYQVVIFPMTALRLALRAMRVGYRSLLAQGTQQELLDSMETRAQLYELLRYPEYERLDAELAEDGGFS